MLLSAKRPGSTEKFSWDCRQEILSAGGGIIQEVVAIYEEAPDGTAVTPPAVTPVGMPALNTSRMVISSLLTGGTVGKRHLMTAEFITTMGEHLYHTIEFDCRAVIVG